MALAGVGVEGHVRLPRKPARASDRSVRTVSVADDTPSAREIRPAAFPYRRLGTALRVSAWGAGVLALFAAIGALLFLHRGDPEGSARIANREIERRLQHGEVTQRRVPVMERRWWNYFRVTHGVLAATDRRLLFSGVPPEDLLPHEPEPPELEEESWTYDALLPTRRQRVFFSTRAGVTIGSRDSRVTLAVSSRDAVRLDSVLAYIDRRMSELRAARVAERLAAALALAASRQAVYHLVDRGETLEEIAKRYGVTAEDLRAWNALPQDKIVAGHRLLVKPGS